MRNYDQVTEGKANYYSVERLDISGMSGGMFKAVGNHGIFI